MSFKRSRTANSSTLFTGDISLPTLQSKNAVGDTKQKPRLPSEEEDLINQAYNPKKVLKQFKAETVDQSRRPRILTMLTNDPVHDAIKVGGLQLGEPTGGLSDTCYYCKKKFHTCADMFMYRGNAFCKAECRDSQMNHDSVDRNAMEM